MGIKFYCPNGHKLNVKDFLAGKRGICPDCGAKFSIPTESTRGKQARARAAAQAADAPTGPGLAVDGPVAIAAPAPATPDPLVDSPDAVWYVRPATGGQFGPADAAAMRRWITEDRVNAKSLVWQSGWPEWKKADGVFPQFGAGAAPIPTPAVAEAVIPAMAPRLTVAANPPLSAPQVLPGDLATGQAAPRRKSKLPVIITVTAMVITMIALAVVLVAVM